MLVDKLFVLIFKELLGIIRRQYLGLLKTQNQQVYIIMYTQIFILASFIGIYIPIQVDDIAQNICKKKMTVIRKLEKLPFQQSIREVISS